MRQTYRFRWASVPALGAVAVAAATLLYGCGGTTGPTKTVSYATTYAAGRIAGFGSIVINGVHYDETTATVLDEDGNVHQSSDLKLGMMAEIQATDYGVVDNSDIGASNVTSATAQTIVYRSLMQGPVSAIDTTAGTLTLFGQTVTLNAATVFDGALSGGLASIKVNDTVKIYGLLPTGSGGYTATRIEPLGSGDSYALRGLVSVYDANAKTLTIGGAVIDVSSLPASVPVGSVVRVKLQPSPVAGLWVAMNETGAADQPQDADHSEVEGAITAFTSATSFSVDGVPVDASGVTLDAATTLALGTRVQVQGPLVKGVLVATSVNVETDQSIQAQGFEVDGAVTAIDAARSYLVVRGISVNASGARIDGGALGDLQVGSQVEVHGVLAQDGVTLNATDINIVPQ